MTPAQIITPYLLQADRENPSLAIENTKRSCWLLLKRTAELAGPDFEFVGKTGTLDGDGKVTPDGFTPLALTLSRDDGERVGVTIVGVSMDALWHTPSNRQVKVIAFSTANEPGPWDHGPAKLTPYDIAEFKDGKRQYRWHNPPIAQSLVGNNPQRPQQPPATPNVPPPPMTLRVPSYGELGDTAFFVGKIGVALDEDMRANGERMNAGSADWIARAVHSMIERFIQHGDNRDADAIAKKVRNQWRAVMNNPRLPQLP